MSLGRCIYVGSSLNKLVYFRERMLNCFTFVRVLRIGLTNLGEL